MKTVQFLVIVLLTGTLVRAQNIGIGTATPNASAMLDINANNKGLLLPRVNLLSPTDITTIATPAVGLLVINTNSNVAQMPDGTGFYCWVGSWAKLLLKENGNTTAGWATRGNNGTNADSNFLGTKDNINVVFKRNNTRAGLLDTANTSWGVGALNPNSTGISNIGIGSKALFSNTAGNSNTATGAQALSQNTIGSDNTAVGATSMFFNYSGSSNTAIGNRALINNYSGSFNTASGDYALFNNSIGNSNVAIGNRALYNTGTQSELVAIGDSALYKNGVGALTTDEAVANTAVGAKALYANATGSSNTATGSYSLSSNISGFSNTAMGVESLVSNETGSRNTAVGAFILRRNRSGSYNTAMGYNALNFNDTGSYNVASGHFALYRSTGDFNIGIGHYALGRNTRNNNIGIGDSALGNSGSGTLNPTEGIANTAIGSRALPENRTGSRNTATGFKVLYSNTSGYDQSAFGNLALYNSITGIQNVAVGSEAAYNADNSYGTYIGYQAGRNTNGVSNTYIGWGAGTNASIATVTTGGNNVCIGVRAGQNITSGSQNVVLGTLSNLSNGTFSNTITLGYGITNTRSNSVVLGNANIIKWGFGVNASDANILEFNTTTACLSTGGTWVSASDRNIKTNFSELNRAEILDRIMQLPITRWNYKKESSAISHIGPMAQDFYRLFNTGNDDKTISTIDPAGVALIGVQELKNEIEALRKEILALKQIIGNR